MAITLSPTSLKRLQGVHPDLIKVVKRAAALSDIDFMVTEGVRTLARQKQLVAAGASKTMRSRHLNGHAVDLAVLLHGKLSWDWPLYTKLSKVVKQAAKEVNVPIEWGGDWKSFRDGPHYQLPWKGYP
jgi:peptidoglycan L-alanyl-D-glutamate endopeptidase CwlK